MRFIIKDWAGNRIRPELDFDSFEDAWGYIRETFPIEEDWQEYFVCSVCSLKECRSRCA